MKNTEILKRIADAFNDRNISWGLGGSMLLNHYGLHDAPRDIDIIVAKDDAIKAKNVLDNMGELQVTEKSDKFVSDFFCRYMVDGCEVDIISGFKILEGGEIYELSEQNNFENEDGIYYCRLEDWYVLYQMMDNGTSKAYKIKTYLEQSGDINAKRLKQLKTNRLNKEIADNIDYLIQLSQN